jgi:hypothetical protein
MLGVTARSIVERGRIKYRAKPVQLSSLIYKDPKLKKKEENSGAEGS